MNPRRKITSVQNRRLVIALILLLTSMVTIRTVYVLGFAQSSGPPAQERKLKTREFKDIPLKVVAVRNIDSETWYKDLEIEIKNTSDKPIYSILAYLVFEDIQVSGGESGIHLMYGDPKNGLIRTRASTRDTHLEPGETYVFKVPEMYKKGLKAKHEKLQDLTKNLVIRFARISFGDGTGYEVERPKE